MPRGGCRSIKPPLASCALLMPPLRSFPFSCSPPVEHIRITACLTFHSVLKPSLKFVSALHNSVHTKQPCGLPRQDRKSHWQRKAHYAMKHFTSLSITGAGVADAVHQRFLHDLQAAECVGLCTRQRPPTTISCRAASMVDVIATLQLVHSAFMSIKYEFNACNSMRCCTTQRPCRPMRLCAVTLACCPSLEVRPSLAFGWLWRCKAELKQANGRPALARASAKAGNSLSILQPDDAARLGFSLVNTFAGGKERRVCAADCVDQDHGLPAEDQLRPGRAHPRLDRGPG